MAVLVNDRCVISGTIPAGLQLIAAATGVLVPGLANRFIWRIGSRLYSSLDGLLEALVGPSGHQYFDLDGDDAILVVSVGEYDDNWWHFSCRPGIVSGIDPRAKAVGRHRRLGVKGRLNDATNLGMFMMMDDVTFFMGGQVVGEFPWSLLPTMDGSYSYEPYRGPGHVNLHIELRAGRAPLCFYKSGAQRISFCVIASPAQGVLTLAGFEVVDDQ